MREGNIYTWECLSVHHCGGGVPHPRFGGGTPSQVWWWGGYSIPGLARGYPIPGLARGWGTPSQVWPGGRVPHLRSGEYPISGWGGTPSQVGGGGYPGYPPWPDLDWGVPGVPPTQIWDGVSPYLDLGQGIPLPRPEMGYPPTWDGVPPT